MRLNARANLIPVMALVVLCGCANNPIAMQNQVETLQQQQLALAQQNQQLQAQTHSLDTDNQELETLLAQARQQTRIVEDQLSAVRQQLGDTTDNLAKLREERDTVTEKAQAMVASVRQRVGAKITANSSLREKLPAINMPGVEVRQDGDVVRVELPGSQLFESGSARLKPGASGLISSAAEEIARTNGDHIVGIEGHTDNDPISTSSWGSNHQLSIGRAMAVYDYVVARTSLRPDQLFITGHGPNHPVVSNATAAGKERNRRVELVIYPERPAGR